MELNEFHETAKSDGQPQQHCDLDPEMEQKEFHETAKSYGQPQQCCGLDPEMEMRESNEAVKCSQLPALADCGSDPLLQWKDSHKAMKFGLDNSLKWERQSGKSFFARIGFPQKNMSLLHQKVC